jgi:hypothetical protein
MAPQIRIDLPADELAHLQARLISEKINWPDLA